MKTDPRRRRERGMVIIEWPLAILLLLVPIAAMAALVPTWSERQTAARDAASIAARTAAIAGDPDTAMSDGEAAARQTASNFGIDPEDLTIDLTGDLSRGGSITAVVTVRMPALSVPGLGDVDGWSWTTSHTERVDDYRSIGG